MKCIWCDGENATTAKKDCHWVEPGGTEMVIVTAVPAIDCPQCQDIYIEDEINAEVELALNTVDLQQLGLKFSYEDLMKAPKMNIFDLYRSGASFRCNK